MNEVYNVLRPILLFQLFTESTLITIQPFLTVLVRFYIKYIQVNYCYQTNILLTLESK